MDYYFIYQNNGYIFRLYFGVSYINTIEISQWFLLSILFFHNLNNTLQEDESSRQPANQKIFGYPASLQATFDLSRIDKDDLSIGGKSEVHHFIFLFCSFWFNRSDFIWFSENFFYYIILFIIDISDLYNESAVPNCWL